MQAVQNTLRPDNRYPAGIVPNARGGAALIERLENRSMFSVATPASQAVDAAMAPATSTYEFAPRTRRPFADGSVGALPAALAALPTIGAIAASTNATTPAEIGIGDVIAGQHNAEGIPMLQVQGSVAGATTAARQGMSAVSSPAVHSFAGRPPKRHEARPTPPTVLVVEDDPVARRCLARLLKDAGWQVTVAASVAEGMRQLESPPQCAILDLMLPDGEGTQLLAHIRAAGLPVHVTVATGTNDPERLARAQRHGPDAVMTKPINIGDLLGGLPSAPTPAAA